MRTKFSLLGALMSAVALLSGCVSAKYKFAKPESTPPPVVLSLAAAPAALGATVDTVIAFQGPGSWKRDAYWDEYRLTLKNRDGVPVTVESASLIGIAGQPATPGVEPWALERVSRSLAEKSFGVAKDVSIQLGSGLGATSLAAGVGAALGGSGWAALGGAAVGVVVAVPTVIGVSLYRNISGRHEIEREFANRRLNLPAVLAPGEIAPGSFFFPITPGPQRLTLRCRAGGDPFDVVIDLGPLAGLHLKAPARPDLPSN